MLGVEVTRACNFRCRHCFVDAGRRSVADPSAERIEELLWRAAVSGVRDLGWSGGEPLLRRDLGRLTARAAALGMDVGLASNGFLASPKRLAELREAGLRVIQISLDGPDARRATRYRRGPSGQFDRALEALRISVELGLQTYACALLAPETLADAEEMVALARSLGVNGLRYTIWMPVGRASGEPYREEDWQAAGLGRFLEVLQRERKAGGLEVLVDCPTGPLPFARNVCGAGRQTAYVTAGGDLYPCTALMFPEYRVGNVFERPLDRLLNDGRMFKVLRELASISVAGECARCELVASCRGGCPGRALAHALAQHGQGWQGSPSSRRRRRRPSMPVCLVRLGRAATGAESNPEASR